MYLKNVTFLSESSVKGNDSSIEFASRQNKIPFAQVDQYNSSGIDSANMRGFGTNSLTLESSQSFLIVRSSIFNPAQA